MTSHGVRVVMTRSEWVPVHRPLAEVAHGELHVSLVPRSRNRAEGFSTPFGADDPQIHSLHHSILDALRGATHRYDFRRFLLPLHSGSRPPGVRLETVSRYHQS